MLVQVNPDTYLGIQYTTHNGDKLSLNRLLEAWVFGKSPNTAKNYLAIANKFLWWVKKDLKSIGLIDLQDYLASLKCVESTKKTKIAVLKSLFTFCHKIGILAYNIGVLFKTQNAPPDQIHSRVLSETEVQLMIRLEVSSRNRLILKTLYLLGLRVSELVGMQWGDFTTTPEKRVVLRVVGKGNKERFVLVPDFLWEEITSVIDSKGGWAVFRSRVGNGKPISKQYVWEIVKKAARRAGLDPHVSPHWLRHAHASHSLDRGAKIHQVRETLGHSSLATTSRYVKSRLENSSSLFLTC